MRAIDYDRGVVIKAIPAVGMEVFMYKDTPGVYLTALGKEIPEGLAAQAGFDTVFLAKKRKQKQMMANAAIAVEAELQLVNQASTKNLIKEHNGYRLYEIGRSGAHVIEDTEGHILTPGVSLTLIMATAVFNSLTGLDEKPAERKTLTLKG